MVSGHFKSGHSDLKKRYNNIVANCNKNVSKYYQNIRKKKKLFKKQKFSVSASFLSSQQIRTSEARR